LALINASWVAGHASPEFATVLVSLTPSPSQRLEMERQLPHEITHILLYQAYGANYSRLPQWFNEGLASLSELYSNADYKRALQKAVQSNSLIPMESLCNGFPRESSGAYLAYAQSESFTRFLFQKYGNASLQELAALYADGVDCQQGIQTVYKTSLDQLELRWKQEYLGMDAELLAWQSLLPYLAILLFVLIPIIAGGLWILRRK
ncbi:MAG TPA: peptidase MA family metallohydrolase, partial [Anaerolineaceae bacterium]|nr:peptidase MA family metallohydrolase [Anaerolineaceae bacterium]